MRCVSLVLIFVVATMASPTPKDKPHYDLANAHAYFEQFIKDYNRQYKNDDDRDVHFHAFIANLEQINKLNEDSPSATFGINKFADYTEEEKQNMRGLGPRPKH